MKEAEDIKRLLRCMWLKAEEDSEHDGRWHLIQCDELSSTFKHPQRVLCSMKGKMGSWPCFHMSAEAIADIILHADQLWWSAEKNACRGTVIASNPFLGCSSIDEACVKADLAEAAQAMLASRPSYIASPSPS